MGTPKNHLDKYHYWEKNRNNLYSVVHVKRLLYYVCTTNNVYYYCAIIRWVILRLIDWFVFDHLHNLVLIFSVSHPHFHNRFWFLLLISVWVFNVQV